MNSREMIVCVESANQVIQQMILCMKETHVSTASNDRLGVLYTLPYPNNVSMQWCYLFLALLSINEGLSFSIVQLEWLGWNYNKVELLTTERENTMAPNLDKVEFLPCQWLNSYDLLKI